MVTSTYVWKLFEKDKKKTKQTKKITEIHERSLLK